MGTTTVFHEILPCGTEVGVQPLPDRHVVAVQIRFLAGAANDPEDRLGLASLVEDTVDKGTAQRDGRALSDAFDTIGASRNSGMGRETSTFTCTVLPEHLDKALGLLAEYLVTPTFPQDACAVSLELAQQELVALQDDPGGLVDKWISRHIYGPILGRHTLGEAETLARITRADIEEYWRTWYTPGRMIVSIAGPVDPRGVADTVQKLFERPGAEGPAGREHHPLTFSAGMWHYDKELEQEQISIGWPGVDATHADFPIQQVVLGVLSGGMSGRLFTEVREKRGLVYWVSAWQEMPRGAGMMFMGASTTPERSDQTFATLLREVDRLGEDLEEEELQRAITGIVAQQETRGDATRARCSELASDLFFWGRPIPEEEKIARIEAVTADDVRRYLHEHPRDRRCVVTLGPRALTGEGDVAIRKEHA